MKNELKIPKKAYKEKEKRNNLKKTQSELDLNNITPKLSQSLIKELYKYKIEEECGLRIEAKYVTKSVVFPSSESEELNNYFKYKTLGLIPRDGITPKPVILKTGKPSIDYARIDSQVVNFNRLMSRLNLSVEQSGFKFTNPKFSGEVDIVAQNNNINSKDVMKKRALVVLKTTALLNDKYSALGWSDDEIEEKDEILIEAIHYKLLAKYEWGIEDIPFYFFVFSNKNDWEHKVFKINIDELTIQQHYNNLLNIKKFLDETMRKGWNPYPKYAVCKDCPLSISLCNYAIDIPKVKEVFI